jgi:phosphoribosylformylglycinamidine cyclo-ligase
MSNISAAYSDAGVDQSLADSAVGALVRALAPLSESDQSRPVLDSGHFANVIRIDEQTGIALSTDGVGTKLLVAEELSRFDTVGIDCVAMNVNDVLCLGAKPVAMLDYLAVESADPTREAQIGIGLRTGAEEAGIQIPGGELAQLGEMMRGFDLAGACFGVIDLDKIVTGKDIQVGDVVIGLPSSGLHANGYTLARRVLDGLPLDKDPEGRLKRSLGDVLIEPTKIYVKPVLDLLSSGLEVRGLAHITSDGYDNLRRLHADVAYEISDPLEVHPIFHLIQELGEVSDDEMREVFNLGCGFCCVVSPNSEQAALEILRREYSEAKPIGRVVRGDRVVHCPPNWPSSAA